MLSVFLVESDTRPPQRHLPTGDSHSFSPTPRPHPRRSSFSPFPPLSLFSPQPQESALYFLNNSKLIPLVFNALSSVASNTTFGTNFSPPPPPSPLLSASTAAVTASFHLAVHKHHLHPGVSPAARRLFPRLAVKSRNSFDRMPAIAWLPPSSGPVRQ